MIDLLNPNLTLSLLIPFLFVLIRVSTIIILAPVFSSEYIPAQVKIAFALVFSIVVFPFVRQYINIDNYTIWYITLIIIENLIIGIMLSLTVGFIWAGIEYAGSFVGFMMGLSIANVLSPQENIQISVLSEFMSIVAILVFLAINGHYIFIKAMVDSFKLIPMGSFVLSHNILNLLNSLTIIMFELAFKILAPAIITLIITNIIFGILARIMPQMNVMIVAFPLSIGLGLFAIGVSLNFSADVMVKYYGYTANWINIILKGF